jgi:hypothetical protein
MRRRSRSTSRVAWCRCSCTGTTRALAVLRAQYAVATVTGVELTGAGFFVEFSIPSDAPRAEPPQLTGGSVRIQVEGLAHGAGCLLFVQGGVLKTLEGFTYGEEWPERPSVVSLGEVVPLLSNAPAVEAR